MRTNLILILLLIIKLSNGQIRQSKELWQALGDSSLPLYALNFVLKAKEKIKPPNDSIISIIDFTQRSTHKRFYIIDLKQKKIIIKTYVAHGMNTGEDSAVYFSNTPKSAQSSPGLYLTDNTYIGKHGYSLKLIGLEKGINDNAYARAIVIHGAWYVSENFIRTNGRLGRSWGCPAVPENQSRQIINIIKNGSLLFIYTKDKNYWKNTKFK